MHKSLYFKSRMLLHVQTDLKGGLCAGLLRQVMTHRYRQVGAVRQYQLAEQVIIST